MPYQYRADAAFQLYDCFAFYTFIKLLIAQNWVGLSPKKNRITHEETIFYTGFNFQFI
jgi:hypothetical protein